MRTTSARNAKARGKRGAVIVEMALVLPLILLLVLGMIDLGLALRDYMALSQLAREGSRYAALGKDKDAVAYKVKEWATKVGLNSASVQVGAPEVDPVDERYMSVRVDYPHKMLFGGFLGLASDPLNLSAVMVVRRE